MANIVSTKKGFRAFTIDEEYWSKVVDPTTGMVTYTSTDNKAQVDIEWSKDDIQKHGNCEAGQAQMLTGSTVKFWEEPEGTFRAEITQKKAP